jgi:methyl-accepting chemotaxis protein
MRLPAVNLARSRGSDEEDGDIFRFTPSGPPIKPGKYSVAVAKRVDGVVTQLAEPVEFVVKEVSPVPLPEGDRQLLIEFQKQVVKLQRDLTTAQALAGDLTTRLDAIKTALDQTPTASAESREQVRKLIAEQRVSVRLLNGDSFLESRNENPPMSISDRVQVAGGALFTMVNKPTGTQRQQFAIARKELDEVAATMKKLLETQVKELEDLLDKLGAPHTPGRKPVGG